MEGAPPAPCSADDDIVVAKAVVVRRVSAVGRTAIPNLNCPMDACTMPGRRTRPARVAEYCSEERFFRVNEAYLGAEAFVLLQVK